MNRHFVTRTSCPACGGHEAVSLFRRSYDEPVFRRGLETFYAEVGGLDYAALQGAEYVLRACSSCGLVYQRDIPDDSLLARLYEEWISPEKAFARYHAQLPAAHAQEITRDLQLTLSLIRSPAPLRALDYGCGWGEWAGAVQQAGIESWGTELSPTRRDACQKAGIKIVDDSELPDLAFDLINADQVFEHLPAPAETLAMLARKVRAGGVIRLAVPNGWRIERALAGFDEEITRPRLGRLNPVAPLEHLNCFRTPSLLRMAARCGLKRVVPAWSVLVRNLRFPSGVRAKIRELLRPAYLRCPWSTRLWLARTDLPGT